MPRPSDRRNLRVVPPTFRPSRPPFRRRAVRRDGRCRRLDPAARQPTAPPTSASPATTSSRASATTCGAGYKTSAGMAPELLTQIPVMEEALVSAGFTTWAMVEHEADDALGAAAAVAEADPRVEQVMIVTPDKDLGQCVRGTARRAVRPAQGRDHRRGRRRRQVRRRPGVDRRLPRPGRRLRRRLSRASPGGVRRARRPSSPSSVRSTAIPAVVAAIGGFPRCVAPRSWR